MAPHALRHQHVRSTASTRLLAVLLAGVRLAAAAAVEGLAPTNIAFFPLTRADINGEYTMRIRLGPTAKDSQEVLLLPALHPPYFDGQYDSGPIFVPDVEMCRRYGANMISPESGEVVSIDENEHPIYWDTELFDEQWVKSLELALRRGGEIVAVIATEIENSGSFDWDVSATARDLGLDAANDYQVMLYSTYNPDAPPSVAFSGQFTIEENSDLKRRQNEPQEETLPAFDTCKDYFQRHGIMYDHNEDPNWVRGFQGGAGMVDESLGLYLHFLYTGGTTIHFETGQFTTDDMEVVAMDNVGVTLLEGAAQGMGYIALSQFQKRRSEEEYEHVVGLYLGAGDTPGSVVLGGHDSALIDASNGAAIFTKKTVGRSTDGNKEPTVQIKAVELLPEHDTTALETRQTRMDGFVGILQQPVDSQLSFHSASLGLPQEILDEIIPILGNPVYDVYAKGYVYEEEVAPTGYSLRMTLTNGTADVNITIPAASLLSAETKGDNPLTQPIETGRTILQLQPGGNYLGRAFLRHTYLVDDAASDLFFLAGVNTTAVSTGTMNLIGGVGTLFDSSSPFDPSARPPAGDDPLVTPADDVDDDEDRPKMLGAIVGGVIGVVAIVLGVFLWWFLRRRRRQRAAANTPMAAAEPEIGYPQYPSGSPAPASTLGPSPLGTPFRPLDKELGGSAESKTPITDFITIPLGVSRSNSPHSFISDTSFADSIQPRPPTPPAKDPYYISTLAPAFRSDKRFSAPATTTSPPSPPLSRGDDALGHRRGASAPLMALHALSNSSPALRAMNFHRSGSASTARSADSDLTAGGGDGFGGGGLDSDTEATSTATLAKFIPRRNATLKVVTPPPSAPGDREERHASVGRVVSPAQVVVRSPGSRRSVDSALPAAKRRTGSGGSGGSVEKVEEEEASDAVKVLERSTSHKRGRSAPDVLSGFLGMGGEDAEAGKKEPPAMR